jgi:hypothetical protein
MFSRKGLFLKEAPISEKNENYTNITWDALVKMVMNI